MKKLLKKAKKGFTLVELVVVIAIIAILSAASVATYFGVTESARKSNVGSTASQIGQLVYLASIDGDDSDNVSTKDSKLVLLGVAEDSTPEATKQDNAKTVLVALLDKNDLTVTKDELTIAFASDNIVSSITYAPASYNYQAVITFDGGYSVSSVTTKA